MFISQGVLVLKLKNTSNTKPVLVDPLLFGEKEKIVLIVQFCGHTIKKPEGNLQRIFEAVWGENQKTNETVKPFMPQMVYTSLKHVIHGLHL